MKKISLLFVFICFSIVCFCQSKDQKQKINEFEQSGLFKIDGNNIVTSRIIDSIPGSKDEIYIRVKNYFARAYNDANSVIQTDDKNSGVVIGKGLYKYIYSSIYMLSTTLNYSAYHILRVDMKEGKARVICSVTTMKVDNASSKNDYDYNIIDYAPFTDKRAFYDKGKQTEAFIRLVILMNESLDSIEKTLKEGALSIEKEDW
jgi:hypothetical protein